MTRIIPFDSIKPVHWQQGGDLPYPKLATDYNSYFSSDDGYQIEYHGLITAGYDPSEHYVSNIVIILSGPDYLVPGYGEYANEQRYSRGDINAETGREVKFRTYDFDIWVLGNTGVIKAALDRQPHFNLPEFALAADSRESDQWLKRVFTFLLAEDKMWGGLGRIRRLRLRKPTADYDVLVQIENPEAAQYLSAPWKEVEEPEFRAPSGGLGTFDWISTAKWDRSSSVHPSLRRSPEGPLLPIKRETVFGAQAFGLKWLLCIFLAWIAFQPLGKPWSFFAVMAVSLCSFYLLKRQK